MVTQTEIMKYRHSNMARLIMSRVHVRPRTHRCSRFNLAAVQVVLDAFESKSVWSGSDDDLTIVRIDKSKPLSVGNAMVLQVREANKHIPVEVLVSAKQIAQRAETKLRSTGALVERNTHSDIPNAHKHIL